MKHSISWILWLVLSMVLVLLTRNPIYLSIILFSLFGLGAQIAKEKKQKFWLIQNIRFLLTMMLISSLINSLFSHTGQTVLFRIPADWFLIGGPITLESLVFGLINGLIIGSLYLAFNILNLALSVGQLTHLIPAALRPIAMTVTITLTFFPSIQQRSREIKEAQFIRGNPLKKIKDWLPLLLPLLISSLENAVRLSESMTSRGFEIKQEVKNTKLLLVGLIAATFAVFSGWILSLYDYPAFISLTLYIFAAGMFVATLLSASSKAKITHYRNEQWSLIDIIASGIFLISIISIIILRLTGEPNVLAYSPYPKLSLPDISVLGLFLFALPLLPLFFRKHD